MNNKAKLRLYFSRFYDVIHKGDDEFLLKECIFDYDSEKI